MLPELRRRLILISLVEAPIIAALAILLALHWISVLTFTVIMVGLALGITVVILINVRTFTTRGDDDGDIEF